MQPCRTGLLLQSLCSCWYDGNSLGVVGSQNNDPVVGRDGSWVNDE